jgi:glycosyltransferase involved in cell wall biosynthesis
VQNDISGYVAENENDFVDGISKLMNDPVRQRRMSEAARVFACRQSWDSVFEGVYLAYETCLPKASLLTSEMSR